MIAARSSRQACLLSLLVGTALLACGGSDDEAGVAPKTTTGPETPSLDGGADASAGGDEDAAPAIELRAVRVAVAGLEGDGLVFANNGQNDLQVAANGTSRFDAELPAGATYDVSVKTQPTSPTQTCSVANGKGTIGNADVTVDVTCTTNAYTVGGTITGLSGTGLVLHNGSEELPVSGSTFAFMQKVLDGQTYDVTVTTAPTAPPQECEITKASGTVAGKDVTDVTVACMQRYFVDVAAGSDANTGLRGNAWKTITHALASVPAGPVEIMVAPGNYGMTAGETFPITMKSDVALIGDVMNKGNGAVATRLEGSDGYYAFSGGSAKANFGTHPYTLLAPPGVTNAAVRGFDIVESAGIGIAVDDAVLTFEAITVSNVNSVAVIVCNGADVDVESSILRGKSAALFVCDETTKTRMRNTRVSAESNFGAVTLGLEANPFTGANIDLGTTASPGGNTFLGGGLGVGLMVYATDSVVRAAGNTWNANVQGADGGGTYAATLVDGATAVPLVAGNNYAIQAARAGQGIQF